MSVRWVLVGDVDEPCSLIRHDSETKEWWELDVGEGRWRPGGSDAAAVLFYGPQGKPPTYRGSRPGVDSREVSTAEAARAAVALGLDPAVIDNPPGGRGRVEGRIQSGL